MATIVRKVEAWPFTFGGELHAGWLPPEAAPPEPAATHRELLDITIEQEDAGVGFLLIHTARWSPTCPEPLPPCAGDSWHETLQDAEAAAYETFGIEPEDWITDTNKT